MFKNLIIVALAVAALLLGTPAWANPLAQAAYDARVKEGGVDTKKANNPADKIYQAVIKAEKKQAVRQPNRKTSSRFK